MKSQGPIPTLSFRKPILRMFSTLRHPISHSEVPMGVPSRRMLASAPEAAEVIRVLAHRAVLVVGVMSFGPEPLEAPK